MPVTRSTQPLLANRGGVLSSTAMKDRTLLYLLSTLIAAAVALAACGGEEESAAEPSATNTPKPAAAQESTESQPVQKPKSYSAPRP